MADHVEFYYDAAEEVRWNYRGGNNEKMADSGEGYKNIQDAQRAAAQVVNRTLIFMDVTAAIGDESEFIEARWA